MFDCIHNVEILSEGDRMAKGRAIKKEPSAWDTACEVTNTVLEAAKVLCPILKWTRAVKKSL